MSAVDPVRRRNARTSLLTEQWHTKSFRRGAAYVLVLGLATVLAVIGFSVITSARIASRASQGANDWSEAGMLAISAAERAVTLIEADPNWRTNHTNGVHSAQVPLGNGTISYVLIDEGDGDLATGLIDPARLYGIGRVGDAVRVYSVLLNSNSQGLSCLEVSLHAGMDLAFDRTTVDGNQIISANNSVSASSATINVDVEAVNAISGSAYSGTQTTGITPREVPDPATVFDSYLARGTPIDYQSLASGPASERRLTGVLLSPASNPYGSGQTNPDGIYVIDCQGGKVGILQCRIVGTLVLLNAGGGSKAYNQLTWSAAVPNYPALLVQGNMNISFQFGQTLDEAAEGINFNPPGTPYNGEEDSLLDDAYPCVIEGLVYVSGDLSSVPQNTGVVGSVVVGNSVSLGSTLFDVQYSAAYLNNPPPGFAGAGVMVPTSGTWQWASLPP